MDKSPYECLIILFLTVSPSPVFLFSVNGVSGTKQIWMSFSIPFFLIFYIEAITRSYLFFHFNSAYFLTSRDHTDDSLKPQQSSWTWTIIIVFWLVFLHLFLPHFSTSSILQRVWSFMNTNLISLPLVKMFFYVFSLLSSPKSLI